ncbi:MAG: hypothetical protein H7A51_07320 [Akkermansiaceae bacterium]|nr:hypothetical protein [Akkermansiaceae bacterium]
MNRHLKLISSSLIAGVIAFGLSGCEEKEEQFERSLGLDAFIPKYNNYIKGWLAEEKANHKKIIEKAREQLVSASGKKKTALQDTIEENERAIERIEFRESLGDYFAKKEESDIPKDLVWEDGANEPEIGDPRAIKGGILNFYMLDFPPTVRPFGKEANNSFRGRIYDELEIGLVGMHPLTNKIIPGVARRWAVSKGGETVYYELDPDAKYNDGVAVTARDFHTFVYIRVSDNVSDPYMKQYFRAQIAQVATYGNKYVSVTLPESQPLMPYFAALTPAASHFYKDYAADYVDYYQWKVAPTTAAYYVKDNDIKKGVSITLTRDKDWWAQKKKYYRYRFNPDKIVYTTIRDDSKAFELFRAGQLDAYYLTRPDLWYEKTEIKPVYNGYIERYKFYTQYPRVPRGAYLNVMRPMLEDVNTRRGIAHALNWQKVIDVIFRGDFSRLQQLSQGFGEYTNPHVKARDFSPATAREFFAKAGYTEEGPDGILRKPSGTPLAINISYPRTAYYPMVVAILKEEAKKAGMELRADGQESTVFYKTVMKKEHDMVIWGWGATPPFPRYYQFFHSSNAVDAEGKPKQQTNNINSYADPKMDKLVTGLRNARTTEKVREYSWEIQQIVHDEALFSPAWMTDYVRIGSWRWLRWPDTKDTPFNVPVIYEPLESHVLWIDEDMKEETLKAMRSGHKFPEVQKVIDVFKDGVEPVQPVSPEKPAPPDSRTTEPEKPGIEIPKPDPGENSEVPTRYPNTTEEEGDPSER